ncbi:MAG: NAD(P)(+) transhydrogenase (Re/Si-specific) subunit alpha, partial [Sphingomonadales bacterium]
MKIAVIRERRAGEARVAATPTTVKKFIGMGFEVAVETGAGDGASIPDADFEAAGATIAGDAAAALSGADIILKVQGPISSSELDEVAAMKSGAVLAAIMNPRAEREGLEACAKAGLTAFAMEFMPR